MDYRKRFLVAPQFDKPNAFADHCGCETVLRRRVARGPKVPDDVVDVDEIKHLRAYRDRDALASPKTADKRRQQTMWRFARTVDLEKTQEPKPDAMALSTRARHQAAGGLRRAVKLAIFQRMFLEQRLLNRRTAIL